MLSVAHYPQSHVDRSRRRIAVDAAAFAAIDHPPQELEEAYFANLVLALDHYFLHRARGAEGKDGNALNEVRVVCDSLTDNDGIMLAVKGMRLGASNTILGLAPGDPVRVDGAGFTRLADAFLAEIESRYGAA